MELQAAQAHKELRGEPQAARVLTELRAALELMEPLELRAALELMEPLEPQAAQVLMEPRVAREAQELTEQLVARVAREQQESVQLEQLAQADHRAGLLEQEQTLSFFLTT
jgi:hypothetical protein